jgi:hypothetical protein
LPSPGHVRFSGDGSNSPEEPLPARTSGKNGSN